MFNALVFYHLGLSDQGLFRSSGLEVEKVESGTMFTEEREG